MASIILKTAGAAVGNALLPGIGGAVLGGLGAQFGGVVDGKLGLGTHVTGPQLQNLSVQDSRYGAGIPVIYGHARVAGNVIWSTDLMQTQHDSSVGKGGGSAVTTTTYTYSVHCAVGICAGPIGGIATIWADSTIIYQNGLWSPGLCDSAVIYTGAAGQTPDAFMQSILGAGSVPSYQGIAYIVFDNLQLSTFGNRLPNLTFEITPSTVSANPVLQGNVDAQLSQRNMGMVSGTMAPVILSGDGAQTVLIGGYSASGSSVTFTVKAFDVGTDTPALLYSVASASFTAASPSDCAWALSPDGRFIALYLQNASGMSHFFAIYDTQAQTFGAVYGAALSRSSSIKPIGWIDALHFAIDDASGGNRGLHIFARAGTGVTDLGFTPLWGGTSTTAVFYGAAFTPYADGLLAYVWIDNVANTLTLQARLVTWRGGAVALGGVYTVASGLSLGTGSGPSACFIPTASGEWTLFYGNVADMRMMSFEPTATAATITRAWQIFTNSYGTGTANAPAFYGDRIIVAGRSVYEGNFRLSEIMLGNGSFALSLDAATVSGGAAIVNYFNATRLDAGRLLVVGEGGFSYDIEQCAVLQRNADGSIAAIVTDILNRAGYAAADYNVSALDADTVQGYVLSEPMSARSAIEPLQAYAPFDLVESDGMLVAVPRGGNAVATVASAEWRAAFDGKTQPPGLLTQRAQEMDLPREIDVDYIDPGRNFEVNSQRARRIATAARAVQKISLPVICDAETAKQVAEARLYTMWAERDLVRVSLSRAWLALDPGDVIDLGTGNNLRIASVTQSGGLLQVEGFYNYAATLASAAVADGGRNLAAAAMTSSPPVLYMMDLPLLRSSDDEAGVYVTATAHAGWNGATVMRSSDGVSYDAIGALQLAATAGIAATVLGDGSGYYADNANSVTVQVTQGSLSSCGFIDMTNGANAALLGREIIQFQTATLIGPGLYQLSNLLRGRRGTESATGSHAAGEDFVLLQNGAVDFIAARLTDRNIAYDFRAVATGQNLGTATDNVFTYGLQTICPLSPANIKGARSLGTTGDLTLTWARRARLNAEWVDYIDVPLDEPQELYEADIMNGGAVMRAFTGLTSPTVTYTAAQQTADWGASVPSSFTVMIYQVSSRYGNGHAGVAVV
ncbi:MAG: phage tail protein [Alphaproteobacteria bacterium]|nr:phage tail protein [Alphaproteobacteria bacterium]